MTTLDAADQHRERSGTSPGGASVGSAIEGPPAPDGPAPSHRGLPWKIVLGGLVTVAAVTVGVLYLRYAARHPATDDAYVGANVVRIAPLVSGRVSSVEVRDYQRVAVGDVLVRIDQRPLRAALDGAEARLALARQQAAALAAAVTAARASQRQAEAALTDAELQTSRVLTLAGKGDATQAERDHATAQLKTAQATLAAARANVAQAEQQLGAPGEENASVKAAEAAVRSAALDLEHTIITAPVAGVVGEVDVRPGAVVTAGTPLFPLVDSGDWWVDANFKETDLQRIAPGQPAHVSLDLDPSRSIPGTVVAVSPASGAAFSLLPPQNASGNWVKVTQRFPVRVALRLDGHAPPLRVGASASVVIDVLPTLPDGRW